VYLKVASPLAGRRIDVNVPGVGSRAVTLNTKSTRTEGLHVVQTGFRPDDISKTATYSLWLNEFGGITPSRNSVEILEAQSGRVVRTVPLNLHKDGKTSDSQNGEIRIKAPIYVIDFTELRTPGTYRLHLPGVGSSYDFEIKGCVWQDAFTVATKGFYYQRNGISHGPPFSTYRAPRAFNHLDGVKVYQSTTSLMDSGNGLNALGTDKDNFGNLVKGATNEVVTNTWGGYKDAGDWDSRIQHLEATRQKLELAEMFPAAIAKVKLNIPESGKGLPDVIAEAKWNIDHYRRLQTPEGGIRGGVEQEEHPNPGETSWMNSLRNFAYAPDPWCSWLYAASATQLSHVLQPIDPTLSREYLESAKRAYSWAEREMVRLNRPSYPHSVSDAKNLAALWLYRETREPQYEKAFRETCKFLRDGAFLFEWTVVSQGESAALAIRSNAFPDVTPLARAAMIRQADQTLSLVQKTTTRSAAVDFGGWPGYGNLVSPKGSSYLIWAHRATGDPKYLKALTESAGFGLGSNPGNWVFTTGVGDQPVQKPFMIDPYYSKQPFPPGITVYGPMFWNKEADVWWKVVEPFLTPKGSEWPMAEAYFDSFWTISASEFTIMESMGWTSFVWGYLAFRP
jgi:endoglucanase